MAAPERPRPLLNRGLLETGGISIGDKQLFISEDQPKALGMLCITPHGLC